MKSGNWSCMKEWWRFRTIRGRIYLFWSSGGGRSKMEEEVEMPIGNLSNP